MQADYPEILDETLKKKVINTMNNIFTLSYKLLIKT